jgi:hypothetical protein
MHRERVLRERCVPGTLCSGNAALCSGKAVFRDILGNGVRQPKLRNSPPSPHGFGVSRVSCAPRSALGSAHGGSRRLVASRVSARVPSRLAAVRVSLLLAARLASLGGSCLAAARGSARGSRRRACRLSRGGVRRLAASRGLARVPARAATARGSRLAPRLAARGSRLAAGSRRLSSRLSAGLRAGLSRAGVSARGFFVFRPLRGAFARFFPAGPVLWAPRFLRAPCVVAWVLSAGGRLAARVFFWCLFFASERREMPRKTRGRTSGTEGKMLAKRSK